MPLDTPGCHSTPLRIEWLIFALYATKLGRTFYKDMLSPSILLFFFLIAEMDVPSAFDRAIRYSVLTYRRSTFDRAVTALLRSFLRFPVTGEVFRSKAECKARLHGFTLSQGFAVVVGKDSRTC